MKSFLALLMVATLAACSTLPSVDAPEDSLTRQARIAQLNALQDWTLGGRIGIRSADEGVTASLTWTQQGRASDIRLSGAFGAGASRIEQSPAGAALYLDGQKPLYGDDAESLLYWETGLRVPLRGLSEWLVGLARAEDEAGYDAYGRLSWLSYLDPEGILWKADFVQYTEVDGIQLPLSVTVQGGGFVLSLIVNEWRPGDLVLPTQDAPPRLSIPGRS